MFPDADVEEARLLPLLMAILDRKFAHGKAYTCHTMLCTTGCAATRAATLKALADPVSAAAVPVWSVRAVLPSYPEFPIGGDFDRKDELFLFHWCAQISLHLLSLFQERLLTPSFVLNAKAAEESSASGAAGSPLGSSSSAPAGQPGQRIPFAVPGCVSPIEDSVLASLCAGGGNYVTAVALLQFLVVRLLRDGLCRPATWCAVYDTKTVQAWRADENCLRQQLFFFAVFLRMWAPLFSGGASLPVEDAASGAGAGEARRKGTTTAAASATTTTTTTTATAKVSGTNVDGTPSLAVLEWLSTGGVLQPRVSTPLSGDATTTTATSSSAGAAGAVTAIDVLFGSGNPSTDRADGGTTTTTTNTTTNTTTGASSGGKKAWMADGAADARGGSAGLVGGKLAARQLVLGTGGGGSAFIPDTLLRVVQKFFEDDLGETRAIAAITSDLMRKRVDRALTSINLLDFVGTSLGDDDDEDEEEEDEEEDGATTTASSSASSRGGGDGKAKVTLNHLRDLLCLYVRPLQ